MDFFILAPAEIASGGPELAHQMCAEIKANGCNAYMYYAYMNVSGPADAECIDKFKKYGTEHITDQNYVDREGNVVIVPEEFAEFALLFHKAKIVLWWMSVDNFFKSKYTQNVKNLDELITMHLTQSKYSESFLLSNGISKVKIMTVSDHIGDIYGQFVLPCEYRKNMILFNPLKGFDALKPLIERTPDLDWHMLLNLTEEEMVVHMQTAKAYVDFGNHPGKDRIPREAAACGCCVITNRKGSAKFHEDVPIPDKYKFPITGEPGDDYEAPAALLYEICNEYNSYMHDFDEYRKIIKAEKNKFADNVKEFITKIKSV